MHAPDEAALPDDQALAAGFRAGHAGWAIAPGEQLAGAEPAALGASPAGAGKRCWPTLADLREAAGGSSVASRLDRVVTHGQKGGQPDWRGAWRAGVASERSNSRGRCMTSQAFGRAGD
jgi:hypothetical protein